jgi:hypothetical protein
VLTSIIPLIPEHFHQVHGHLVLNQFLQAYQDLDRRFSVLKALAATSTLEYFKKDYAEMKTGLVESLILIIKAGESNPLSMRELAFNILAYLCTEFRPL